jgi:hypothetical protein
MRIEIETRADCSPLHSNLRSWPPLGFHRFLAETPHLYDPLDTFPSTLKTQLQKT